MKKKLLIALAIVLVLVIGVLGYAAINANSLIARFKPDLEKIASETLGSKVSLGTLSVSVFPETRVVVDEFKVLPKGGVGEGLTLKNLTMKVGLMPLLGGKLDVTRLSLDSPSITMIKDADGTYLAGLPKPSANADARASQRPEGDAQKAPAAKAGNPVPAGLSLNVREFALSNATLILDDRIQKKELRVSNVNVNAGLEFSSGVATVTSLSVNGNALSKLDFNLDGSGLTFDLGSKLMNLGTLVAKVAGSAINIKGSIDASGPKGSVNINSTGVGLAAFNPLMHDFVPATANMTLAGSVTPNIDATFGPGGTYQAKGTVGLSDLGLTLPAISVSGGKGNLAISANQDQQSATSSDLAFVVGDQTLNMVLESSATKEQATVSKLDVTGLGGTAKVTGTLGLADQKFSSNVNAAGMRIEKALGTIMPGKDPLMTGLLKSFAVSVTGALGETLMNSLSGPGSVVVTDGSLVGFNLANQVLKGVQGIPFISGGLYSAVPEGQKGSVDSSDTPIKSMTANFTLAAGRMNTSNLVLESNIFRLEGSGSVGFDMSLDLKTTFIFTEEFTAALVGRVKELKRLVDEKGRLVIPLELQGKLPAVIVIPDVQKLVEVAGKRMAIDQAEKALGKALGGSGKGLGGLLGF